MLRPAGTQCINQYCFVLVLKLDLESKMFCVNFAVPADNECAGHGLYAKLSGQLFVFVKVNLKVRDIVSG